MSENGYGLPDRHEVLRTEIQKSANYMSKVIRPETRESITKKTILYKSCLIRNESSDVMVIRWFVQNIWSDKQYKATHQILEKLYSLYLLKS